MKQAKWLIESTDISGNRIFIREEPAPGVRMSWTGSAKKARRYAAGEIGAALVRFALYRVKECKV